MLSKRGVFRQQVIARGHDRGSREDHRAELTPAIDQPARGVAVAGVHVEVRPVDPAVLGQMRGEHRGRVDATGTLPMAVHFLQSDDVGALDLAGDAREVVAVVLAETVLNVVGDELHGSLTARAASDRLMSFSSGARLSQLQHAAVRRQNQLLFRDVAERFVGARHQRLDTFDFVLADIDHAQHDRFLADGAQDGHVELAGRALDGNDVQLGLGQPGSGHRGNNPDSPCS